MISNISPIIEDALHLGIRILVTVCVGKGGASTMSLSANVSHGPTTMRGIRVFHSLSGNHRLRWERTHPYYTGDLDLHRHRTRQSLFFQKCR